MRKVAFVFPGQGSQCLGMGRGFYESNDKCKAVIDEADAILGFKLSKLMFDGPVEELNLTSNTQPALLASSMAAFIALREAVAIKPAYLAGHSLGEYTALVAAGALSFKDAVRVVHLRGKFMQESVPEGKGRMSAVLGLDDKIIAETCAAVSIGESVVVAANLNSPGQVVISGEAQAVERAGKELALKGAKKVIPLSVSVPSHSPLMAGAAQRLADELFKINISGLDTPVVTNVEATASNDSGGIAKLLELQLTSPVRWVESIEYMARNGVDTIVEVGPSKVLTSLIKRIDKGIATFNVSEPVDIETVVNALS